MKKLSSRFFMIGILSMLLLPFQNCSSSFQSLNSGASSLSESSLSSSSSAATTATYGSLTLPQGTTTTLGGLVLAMQADGNLVLYSGATPLWYTGTAGQNCGTGACLATFQNDGNLVVYNGSTALWNSQTGGHPGAQLILSATQPYLKIQNTDGSIAWASFQNWTLSQGQSINLGGRTLVMQTDGNLVLYSGSTALWNSQTAGQDCSAGQCFAAFQGDGNFVVYNKQTALWNSGTAGNATAQLSISNTAPYLKIQTPDNSTLWDSSSGNSANYLAPTAVNAVLLNGQSPCNSSSFAQVPTDRNYFIGRVLNNTSADLCSGSTWSLILFKMDWTQNVLHEVSVLFQPPYQVSTGQTISSAYDPHVVVYNNELWVAFECTGNFGYGASSCIAPFSIAGGIDVSRMTIAVMGTMNSSNTEAFSASVPKLLVYQGGLYIYWTACHFVSIGGVMVLVEDTTRGAQLVQESSSLRRLWTYGAQGSALAANDPGSSVEVYGGTAVDSTANSLADMADVYTDGTQIYAIAGVGSVGCVTPLSPLFGCYRTRIAFTQSPLGYHAFNANFLESPVLPANPQEYTHLYTTPNGGHFLMGHYLSPTLNGSTMSPHTIPAGIQKYPFIPSQMKFAPTGVANDGIIPSPTVNSANLAVTFSILSVFHSGCTSAQVMSGACHAAIARFCQSQGYAAGGFGPTDHSGDNAIVTCLRSTVGAILVPAFSDLQNYNSNCTVNAATGDSCASAISHYCQAQGYATGFGPEEDSGIAVTVTCAPSTEASLQATTFTQLSTFNSSCPGTSSTSDSCLSASTHLCQSKGYNTSFGVSDHVGDAAIIGCAF